MQKRRWQKSFMLLLGMAITSSIVLLSSLGSLGFVDSFATEPKPSPKFLPPLSSIHFLKKYGEIIPLYKSPTVDQTKDTLCYRSIALPYLEQKIGGIGNKKNDVVLFQKKYFLGTDHLGRDIAQRILLGTKVSLVVGICSVCIALILGISLGLASGYYGGKIDQWILGMIQLFWTLPSVLLAMAISLVFQRILPEQKYISLSLAIGFSLWMDTARMIRIATLQLKEKEYIKASICLGYSDFRILSKHIFPNLTGLLVILLASNMATAITMESGLSYLGLGIAPPETSLGIILRDSYTYLESEVGYFCIFPALVIVLLVLGFYSLGQGLRDILDVKTYMD
jgi:peptide/nickel transport system permease protein